MFEHEDSAHPKRKIIRTPGIEQHDIAMAAKRGREVNKARKDNIQSQREALAREEEDERDSPSPPPFAIVLQRVTPRSKSGTKPKQKQSVDNLPRSSPPPESEAPVPRRTGSQSKSRGDLQPEDFKAATPPPRSTKLKPSKETSSRPKDKEAPRKIGSQPKSREDLRMFEAATPPPRSIKPKPTKEASTRPKETSSRTKDEAEREEINKLVGMITIRDKRCDHGDLPLKTLRIIWRSGGPAPITPSDTPENRYKGINALGSTDLEPTSSHKTKSTRKAVAPGARSATASAIPRHSTPITSLRAPSKGYRPSPVPSGAVARVRSVSVLTSRSSSPFERSDRDVASDFDGSFIEEVEGVMSAQTPKQSGRKPKLGDYAGVVKDILDATYKASSARLITQGFFPGHMAVDELIVTCWREAARDLGVDPDKAQYEIDENHRRLTHYRITSLQGRIKAAVVDGLKAGYKLGDTPEQIMSRASNLLPHGFHTEPDSEPGKGQYQHPYIEAAINAAFFTVKPKSTPVGVIHKNLFGGPEGMPLPPVALVCGFQIEWGLEKYQSSATEPGSMQAKTIEKYFDTHIANLGQFKAINPDLTRVMRQRWYVSAFAHAKISTSKADNKPTPAGSSTLPLILPDVPSEKDRRAVADAWKRLQHSNCVKAPDVSDKSGGFDDVGDSDVEREVDSDAHADNAFRRSPRRLISTQRPKELPDAPPAKTQVKPRPAWKEAGPSKNARQLADDSQGQGEGVGNRKHRVQGQDKGNEAGGNTGEGDDEGDDERDDEDEDGREDEEGRKGKGNRHGRGEGDGDDDGEGEGDVEGDIEDERKGMERWRDTRKDRVVGGSSWKEYPTESPDERRLDGGTSRKNALQRQGSQSYAHSSQSQRRPTQKRARSPGHEEIDREEEISRKRAAKGKDRASEDCRANR